MEEQTLFERILSGEIPSHEIDSGDGWYAFLDIFPRREGHTLVIPTAPVQRIADLSEEQRTMLMNGVVAVQKRLSNHFNTTDFTVVVHDGPLAGQEVPHVHVHVLSFFENCSRQSDLTLNCLARRWCAYGFGTGPAAKNPAK